LPAIPHRFALAAMLLAGSAAAAMADPPARVGRVSLIEGALSLSTPDQPQWSPAGLNYPVTTGETFWTEPQSRGEIQIGATELRLDEQTELGILRLDETGAVIRVDQGVVNVHVVAMPPGGVQIVTRAGQVDLERPGSYHIDAGRPGPNGVLGNTEMNVLDGSARLTGPRTSVEILPGEGAVITADLASLTLIAGNATPFDNWALSRERREVAQQSSQYLSPETTGYQDLDVYGQWVAAPGYGTVWYPAVGPDWAPYREGHWARVAPWGWTWIDDAPWGFAPFHYGRWIDFGDRWAWLPDPRGEFPVYAPALVVFIGGGSGGPVGWVPLGPHEAFHPYYQASEAYTRRLDAAHFGNQAEFDRPRGNGGDSANRRGMTMVPQAAFTGAAPVGRSRIMPSEQPHSFESPRPQGRSEPDPEHWPAPSPAGRQAPPAAASPIPVHAPDPQIGRAPEPSAPRETGGNSTPWHQPQTERQTPAPAERTAPPVLEHPAQPARLMPTQQGWVRSPAPEERREAPRREEQKPQQQRESRSPEERR